MHAYLLTRPPEDHVLTALHDNLPRTDVRYIAESITAQLLEGVRGKAFWGLGNAQQLWWAKLQIKKPIQSPHTQTTQAPDAVHLSRGTFYAKCPLVSRIHADAVRQ